MNFGNFICNEDQFSLPSLRMKEESKDSVYDVWKRMKKRHVKSLHKQTFEEELLSEFRQFFNGVMSRLDNQNKILAQLISIQKSSHTSFPAVQISMLSRRDSKWIMIMINMKL